MLGLFSLAVTSVAGCSSSSSSTPNTPTTPSPAPQTVIVFATDNLSGAGHFASGSTPDPGGGGGGTAAKLVLLQPGIERTVSILSATGTVGCGGSGSNNADGGTACGVRTDITSWAGTAGALHPRRTMFLAGLFLDNTEPADPAPARIDSSTFETATTLAPGLRQVFFVGDGQVGNGTGARQVVTIPTGAARFYLGFAEAPTFVGSPGGYADNTGQIVVSVETK